MAIKTVTAMMCLNLMFHDVETDGQHNYLVRQRNSSTTTEYFVAFNSQKDVSWVDGFCYRVVAECEMEAKALDPPLPGDNSWGYPRSAPVCMATSIERRGWIWPERSK